MAKNIQYRELRLVSLPDTETRTFTIPVSSDLPVTRWWGTETLRHAPEAIAMDRLQDGAPLLLDHDTGRQIGIVEHAALGADNRLNATIRFGRSSLAEEVFQDVMDGIRRNVSIGYQIEDIKQTGKDDFEVTRWMPMEISVVSVPADNHVGFGRSGDYDPTSLIKRIATMNEETPIVDESTDEAAIVDIEAIVERAVSQERSRTSGIRAVVKLAKLEDSVADTLIESGKSLEECRAEVMRLWSEKVDQSATESGRAPEGSAALSRAAEISKKLLAQVAGVEA